MSVMESLDADGGESPRMTAHLPRSLLTWLTEYARRNRINRSEALRRILEGARERDQLGR